MKKRIFAFLAMVVLIFAIPVSNPAAGVAFVGGHYSGHGWYGRGGGGYYWGGPVVLGPWPWYPYGWGYPYPYYTSPPVIIQQQPPVYSQRTQPESDYWYYCQNPQGYYPYVKSCPGGWMKVVPETPKQ